MLHIDRGGQVVGICCSSIAAAVAIPFSSMTSAVEFWEQESSGCMFLIITEL